MPTNTQVTDLDKIEKPLLINPEVTDLRNHLAINPIGEIYALNKSPQGEATMLLLNLSPNLQNLVMRFFEEFCE